MTLNKQVSEPFRAVLNSYFAPPLFPNKPAGMAMSIWHYKRRAAGDACSIGGCSCRGCMAWARKQRAVS